MNFYNEKITPIIKNMCELDKGKNQVNYGQMKEIIHNLAVLINEDVTILNTLNTYSVYTCNSTPKQKKLTCMQWLGRLHDRFIAHLRSLNS